MKKKSLAQLRARAVSLGAHKAKIIKPSTVITAAWVFYKCQYGCDGFAQCFTCPPHSPSPEATRKILDCYRSAILIHCKKGAKKDISQIALELEKEAFFAGYYKAIAMGAGPCRLCRSCSISKPCRYRERARPSMEACGIDVYATARLNGFTINTLDSYSCPAHYFSLVLVK